MAKGDTIVTAERNKLNCIVIEQRGEKGKGEGEYGCTIAEGRDC
jgi:hypothetical protein